MRVLIAAALVLTAGACTTVTEVLPPGSGGADVLPTDIAADAANVPDDGPPRDIPGLDIQHGELPDVAPGCLPNPCDAEHKHCLTGGVCGPCLPGWTDDGAGGCVPTEDPCDPDPCAALNKQCVGGFCADCLAGFSDDGSGNCRPPDPCQPNPCVEGFKTVCAVTVEGVPKCFCDPGAHNDGTGRCTFDPCLPNKCEEPLTRCVPDGFFPTCTCPGSELELNGECVVDPCQPNPCTGYARTTCSVVDLATAEVTCACIDGFALDPETDSCVEVPVQPFPPTEPVGDPVVGGERLLFVDDWLVATRTGLQRRLHSAEPLDDAWSVGPEIGEASSSGDIGRAKAGGSVVEVPQEVLDGLPEGDVLRPYRYRLYYLGHRYPFSPDAQPSWVCMAVAEDAAGPWIKPQLLPDSPAPHCVMRADGLVQVEVSLVGSWWLMSATQLPFGATATAGLYIYGSSDGVSFTAAPNAPPVLPLSLDPVPPAIYARIGDRSRVVRDPSSGGFVAFVSLPSAIHGEARGIVFGGTNPAAGWPALDAVTAPAILGPSVDELVSGTVYGDMTAWRVGDLWLGIQQKGEKSCPKRSFGALVASRNGRHWWQVRDEVSAGLEAVLPYGLDGGGGLLASIDSLSGGAPLEADGLWQFFVGGLAQSTCDDGATPGGVLRMGLGAGRLVGLEVDGAGPGIMATKPFRLRQGVVASVMELDVTLEGPMQVRVESLSAIGSVLDSAEVVLGAGDHKDVVLDLPPLNGLLGGERFRVRFTFTGAGEVFGFRFSDPLCADNPCDEDPERGVCDSSSGAVVCGCSPPLHDDGLGHCSDDPCLPNPCLLPNQDTCEVVDGAAVCGCVDGFVWFDGACIPDPCTPVGPPPCAPPGPNKCRVVGDQPECYCPEGSEETAGGCVETDPRVFVTSLGRTPAEIGGRDQANIICAGTALAAGMPGQYAAWLATPEVPAAAPFVSGGPWRTWDPKLQLWTRLVATDLADLTDGMLSAAIAFDEQGNALTPPEGETCAVWTGALASGSAAVVDLSLAGDCGGWTSADPELSALAGDCRATDLNWTQAGSTSCDQALRLFCFQLPQPPSPEPPSPEP